MMSFRILSLEQPESKQPANLLKLANNLRNTQQFTQLYNLPTIEIDAWRSLDEIIDSIQLGNTNQITRLEWVYCLYNKAQWDLENPEISRETSALIWQAALTNLWLQKTLLWLVVINSSESQQIISKSLVETFSIFVSQAKQDNSQIIQIIQAITKGNYQQLALLAGKHNLTPQELLNNANLPSTIPTVHQALNHVVRIFVKNKQSEWLLRCFEQMSQEQQCQQVNNLLITVSAEQGSRFVSVVEWLRQNYGPRTINSRWYELSQKAQSALRQWIGAATWGDFEKLINLLLQDQYRYPEREKSQLESRKGFWSNYSDRFERLRILIPESTRWISQELTRDIDIDESSPTEVCIFDFGDLFIVEFFRGPGSEMLLFKRDQSPDFEKTLFESRELSIIEIRRLLRFGGKIHDHVYLWQYYAEKLLRTQNRIYPNDGTRYFQGLPAFCNRYSRATGLPVPSPDKQRKREENLVSWYENMERLYRRLGIEKFLGSRDVL
ncbi:EH signature domain-containing protein [Nostoc sp. FACHB-190]|uniref:EH signature domain-containing protein n=1 Tax=Nostoc sp. FACHB-190 TaxID=2692838 RepID=UPI001686023B|nr:EH signature domain-containing protein [Nostoc sp. FACHB-190]MBD2298622.1 hypothetical protein [Nostoc sp. FACHB-190]